MVRSFQVESSHAGLISRTTLFKALKYVDKGAVDTPLLLLDGEKVKEKIASIGGGIIGSKVFFAVKANPDIVTLRHINEQEVGFEISSEGELDALASLDVQPARIISSNPIKSQRFLEKAFHYGVNYYAFDSAEEVEKMAKYAPEANVYVRLSVPNEGSEWPLSKKFGVELDEALILLLSAAEKGLNPVGVTFHVGSQCTNPYNWNIALDKARILWSLAEEQGLCLKLLNIGGGYPVNYTRNVISIDIIEENINRGIQSKFSQEIDVHIEPGRAVVADAGVLVTTVIGKARRREEDWLYIDVGVFNGLMESLGGIKYAYLVESEGVSKKNWTLAGPSCDSFDVIDRNVSIWDPKIGNLLLVLSGGAYTLSYASEFNGFSIPQTVII